MRVKGLDSMSAALMAAQAVTAARRLAPKLTGDAALRITPISGPGWFGLHWADYYLWFQETGIRPFTMRSLAGKVIPMWIDDPTGLERSKNRKAQIRWLPSGRVQVLLFRRAAKQGQRKVVNRNGVMVDVPMSYPGAPGRITRREAPAPYTRPGKLGGQIAKGNVGVRWRHPGVYPKWFLHRSLELAAEWNGVRPGKIEVSSGPVPQAV
jgi:hypothetical protein